jgi:hypothetical protein
LSAETPPVNVFCDGQLGSDSSEIKKLLATRASISIPFIISSKPTSINMVSLQTLALILALLGGAYYLFGRSSSSTSSADRLAADPALVNGNKAALNGNGAADTGRDFVAAMEQAVSPPLPSFLCFQRFPVISCFNTQLGDVVLGHRAFAAEGILAEL